MKKIVSFICACSGFFAISQNITYKIGNQYEVTLKHKDHGYFLAGNNTPVNLSFMGEHDYSIQPIDLNTLNVSPGYTHDVSSLGEDVIFEKLLNLKDNLFTIYSSFNKKTKTRTVYGRLIDDNNKTLLNNNVALFESKDPKVVFLQPMKGTRYNFSTSRNKEYSLLTCFYEDREKKAENNKQEMGFCVFDKNLNVKVSKVVEMPYFENSMSIESYNVDSKGNLFMLLYFAKQNGDGTRSFGGYELVKIGTDGVLQKKELNTNGIQLNNAIMTDDLNGNIVLAGYYLKDHRITGTYIYKFGPDGDIKADGAGLKMFEFNADLFRSYENEATIDKMNSTGRLDASLYFDDIFFHPNGDIVIVNEQYKSVDNSNSVNLGPKNYYLDIITLKIDKDGKLVWMKKIPKNQTGSGRSDLSYKYHYNNGNDYFIFVDNENNMNLAPDQAPATHICRQGGYLVAVKIDAQGKTEKLPIFDLRKEGVSVFPFDMFKVNENTLIGKCLRERSKTVIELNFK